VRRVHVASAGAVTAFGEGRQRLADAVFAGESAIRPLDRLAGAKCTTRVAAEVPPAWADPERLARGAMRECGEADALVLATTKADLSGVVGEGEGLGIPYRLAARLANGKGPVAAVSCACASGLSALALAARWIRSGHADRVLVVGVDTITEFILAGFSSLLALDLEPCRPYDETREGLSLGEAAGAMLLTAEETGIELKGWAESNDANHITGPRRDGKGLLRAAAGALDAAGVAPGDVDYVHTHATGTPYFDAMEGEALTWLYRNGTPPVSGTKAQTGHTLGAAGVIESILALEALERRTAPANVRLVNTDLDPRVDLVREPRPLDRARTALKLSAGFGGINAALVFQVQ